MSNVQWLLMQIIISEAVSFRNTMYFCRQGAVVTLCAWVPHNLRDDLPFHVLTSHFVASETKPLSSESEAVRYFEFTAE